MHLRAHTKRLRESNLWGHTRTNAGTCEPSRRSQYTNDLREHSRTNAGTSVPTSAYDARTRRKNMDLFKMLPMPYDGTQQRPVPCNTPVRHRAEADCAQRPPPTPQRAMIQVPAMGAQQPRMPSTKASGCSQERPGNELLHMQLPRSLQSNLPNRQQRHPHL